MELLSHSTEETGKIAEQIAQDSITDMNHDQAIVIALEGELGAGKTVFVQAFARALGIGDAITSPTFVILKHYSIPTGEVNQRLKTLYHIDAYRLNDHTDLEKLGLRELMTDPANIILIEWADRVAEILPPHHITIHIDHINDTDRRIIITK